MARRCRGSKVDRLNGDLFGTRVASELGHRAVHLDYVTLHAARSSFTKTVDRSDSYGLPPGIPASR